MTRSDNELISKYENIRKVLREEQEQKLPESYQRFMDVSKALGHLEGSISVALQRLKGSQIELNSPEINVVIEILRSGLDKAKELAPSPQLEKK